MFRTAAVFLALACAAIGAPRLAVLSGTDAQPVADLIMARLSQGGNADLVERADINKVFNEQELAATVGLQRKIDLSRLLRAQGLLLLDVTHGDGAPVARCRMVAVDSSVVILDIILPFNEAKVDDLAGLLERRVEPLLAKLEVSRAQAIPVSILNIRADLATPASSRLQEEITTQLANRLSAEPAIFVLERRRMDLLANEKTLGDQPVPSFDTGAYLLDGEISTGKDDLSVHLRMRAAAGGKENDFHAEGASDNIGPLIDKLARDIISTSGHVAAAPWNAESEAKEYYGEAVWAASAWNNALALNAAESAAALGLKTPALLALRTTLLADKSSPAPYINAGRTIQPPMAPLGERLDAAWEALDGYNEYLRINGSGNGGPSRESLLLAVSSVLKELLDQKSAEAEPLRVKIREVAGFDPTAGRFPADWTVAAQFAPYWTNDGNELAAYYAGVLAWRDTSQGRSSDLFYQKIMKEHFALFARCPDRAAAFKKFFDDIEQQPDGWEKSDGRLAVAFIRYEEDAPNDEKQRTLDYGRFLDEFWARREAIKEGRMRNFFYLGASTWGNGLHETFAAQHVKILRYYFENAPRGTATQLLLLWCPQYFPKDQVADIWKAYQSLKARTAALGDKNAFNAVPWGGLETGFYSIFPAYKPAGGEATPTPLPSSSPPAGPFVTAKYWSGAPSIGEVQCHGDEAWLLSRTFGPGGGIFVVEIDLKTMQAQWHKSPIDDPGWLAWQLGVSPDAVYLTGAQAIPNGGGISEFDLLRMDRTTGQWEKRTMPTFRKNSLYVAAEAPYFDLRNDIIVTSADRIVGGTRTCGLARYDWSTARMVLLASSTRKPGHNQFDDCPQWYDINGIFEGPAHSPCTLIDGRPYAIREDAGAWKALFPSVKDPGGYPSYSEKGFWSFSGLGSEPLIYSARGDVAIMDPGRPEPNHVMVSDRTAALLPQWAAEALWRPLDCHEIVMHNCFQIAARQDEIFSLHRTQTGNDAAYYYLRWYHKGGHPGGDRIGVRFEGPPPGRDPDIDIGGGNPVSNAEMHVCNAGIVFSNSQNGFWFVPYASLCRIQQ